MVTPLVKGQKIDLTKNNPELNLLHIGLDWNAPSHFDIDVSAFMVGADDKIIREEDFVFYGQPISSNGSVCLEESISTIEKQHFMIDLLKVPADVNKISFTLSIYESQQNGQSFKDVSAIQLKIANSKNQEELATFPIDYSFTKETAIELGAVYRYSDKWKFQAVGAGFYGGLDELCRVFRVEVEEQKESVSSNQTDSNSSSPNERFQVVQEQGKRGAEEDLLRSSDNPVQIKRNEDSLRSMTILEESFDPSIVDFIAIDFETANNKMSSACSLGLVFVKDHTIVDEKYYLIQPPNLEFDSANTRIHGMTAEDVRNAKQFDGIWDEIKEYFEGTTIIAHNAQFDMSVLHSCLTEYSLTRPDFNYICSIPLSTGVCGGNGIGNSLKERLAYFDLEINNHHNAISDARACAELVITCMKTKNQKTLQTYVNLFGISVRRFDELKPQFEFRKNKFKKSNRVAISDIAVTVETISTNHPFFQRNIVFTGELNSLERKEAMQQVVNSGGIIKSGVSSKTDFLIVGVQDKSLVGESGLSTKERKANELINKGKAIRILNEEEFIQLLHQ
ncbi:TerD family protein [Neobacillus bataviensis]|uniref:TerD family protein n=1 Tax=Neobacillus bataviensis TaxID=220685 RepID=UPI001CBF92E2|nr:TerD family protein [Neobacillus bataviensis]